MYRLDLSLFNTIHGLAGHSAVVDWLLVFCAQYLIYGVVLGVVFAGFRAWQQKRHATLSAVVVALAAAVVARYGVAELIRHFYQRPRPYVALNIPHLLVDTAASFPSGHTIFMFALATCVFTYNRRDGWWLFGIGTLIGTARIAAGVHYPSDILGGMICGIATGAVCSWLYRSWKNRYSSAQMS